MSRPAPQKMRAAETLLPAQQDRPPELRSYQLVAERVREYVHDAGIPPGGRLPAERNLAPLLGVSRASLREALIALELGGVVEVRGGSGVYLVASPDSPARVPVTGPGPFEVLASRRLIEPEAAAMAARVATPAAIDNLLAVTEELERQQHDKSGCESADRAFHVAIARATGNSALVGVVEYLWSQRGNMTSALEDIFETEELRKEALADHRRIVQAIAAHDAAAAKHAMRSHLERVTRMLSRG